jgi:hypothetical protein
LKKRILLAWIKESKKLTLRKVIRIEDTKTKIKVMTKWFYAFKKKLMEMPECKDTVE